MSKKLNLTVSEKNITERCVKVTIGSMFSMHFDKYCGFIHGEKGTLSPHASTFGVHNATAEGVRRMLEESIKQVEAFDKEAALAELKQALEQVDEIVELVK